MLNKFTKGTLIAILLFIAFAPSAHAKVVSIISQQIELKDAEAKATDKWSLAIREVFDKRGAGLVGTKKIGTADRRFSAEDATVELDRQPVTFLREQVGRFFLLRIMVLAND